MDNENKKIHINYNHIDSNAKGSALLSENSTQKSTPKNTAIILILLQNIEK